MLNGKKIKTMNDMKNNGWDNQQTEKQFGDKINQNADNKNKTEKTVEAVKNGAENAAARVGEAGRKMGDDFHHGAEKAADKIGQAADKTADRLQNKKNY